MTEPKSRRQLLFLANGFGVNCSLTAVHRAELDAGHHQTFAFRGRESRLTMLELEPVLGGRPRQFLEPHPVKLDAVESTAGLRFGALPTDDGQG